MRICIYGAGAIGGFIGARLARTDADISLVARGPHCDAIKRNGLTLIENGESTNHRLRCVEDCAELGPQDFVIITLKAHSVGAICAQLPPLFHADTTVVPAVNGVPWWYFHRHGGVYEGSQVTSVDPDGKQWQQIGPDRVLGCVIYPACEVVEPGVIKHLEGERLTLGEPSGEKSARAQALAALLRSAGLKAPVKSNIRDELWIKLWGNVSFNPVSALTGATLDRICRDLATRRIVRSMMLEAQAVAEHFGVRFPIDVEQRIAGAEAVGAHKTSMLQDIERGRPSEIEAMAGAVSELGRLAGVPTPLIDSVAALVRLRECAPERGLPRQ
jgi:2-dehydropantoate 2-reductase